MSECGVRLTTMKRFAFDADGELAMALGTAQKLSATRAAVRIVTAMRLFLDTLTPVSHGTSERRQQLWLVSHQRDSLQFQLQIRYRGRYTLHGVGSEWANFRAPAVSA